MDLKARPTMLFGHFTFRIVSMFIGNNIKVILSVSNKLWFNGQQNDNV